MKYFIPFFSILIIAACSMSGGNGTHFQSYGNYYTVELIDFNDKDIEAIKKQLDNKTFNIKTEEIVWPSKGHTFLIQSKDQSRKYHFKIKKIQSEDGLSVNIQGFINENGKQRRVFNPGNFNTINSSFSHKDQYDALRFLLIQLSYK